jgi:hypothetical protein
MNWIKKRMPGGLEAQQHEIDLEAQSVQEEGGDLSAKVMGFFKSITGSG